MQIKSFLKTLQIIHGVLCISLGVCAVYVYFQNSAFKLPSDNSDIMIYIVPIVAIIGYFGSLLWYQKQLQKIKENITLGQKLKEYFNANMVQYAFIEGAAFFAIFAYFNSGNALFLIIIISLILYLYTRKPSYTKLNSELSLSLEDQKEFNTLSK